MKKIFTLNVLIFIIVLSTFSQKTCNLVLFAVEATPFYAVVNGIKQNTEPQTNVKITGLTNNANSVKIIFKDSSIPDINKNFYSESMNVQMTARIVNTKKGYKLRYFGEVPLESAPVAANEVKIVYQTTPPPTVVEKPRINSNVVEETITTTTTSTTNTDLRTNTSNETPNTTESMNVDMNVGGINMGMNININTNEAEQINSSADIDNVNSNITTTTTTTTTTTSSSGFNTNYSDNNIVEAEDPIYYVDGYSGNVGCEKPMNNVNSIINAINNESFDDDKLMIAKQAIKNKCLKTDDVIKIIELITFEDTRLELAKFAYNSTYDIDDYYKVNSVFKFSSNKEELNEFISNK